VARETVRIEELRLRIPGLSVEEARQVGQNIARHLADAIPAHGKTERLGALVVRTEIPAGTPREQLAGAIARAILENLR
jgi:hypothetical protein